MAATNAQWKELTKQFVDYCKEKSCKNAKDVKNVIKAYLTEQYGGKAPKARINGIADDFAESVCLELGF